MVANEKVDRFQFDRSEILNVRWASVSATEALLRPSRKRVLGAACRTLQAFESQTRGSVNVREQPRAPAVCELDQQLGALLIAPLPSPYAVTSCALSDTAAAALSAAHHALLPFRAKL